MWGIEGHLDADHRPGPGMRIGEDALDLDGEGPEPTLGAAGHGGERTRAHPRADERVGGFVDADGAQLGKVTAVQRRASPRR
jgi:hypothetical protein